MASQNKLQIYVSDDFEKAIRLYAKSQAMFGHEPNLSQAVRELVIAGLEAKRKEKAQ